MREAGQGQAGGFSRSEKVLLAKAVGAAIIASAITLWLGGVFSGNTPVQSRVEVVLACLFSFGSAAAVSVMGETVIEDVIKLLMFGVLWWFTRKYSMFDLVTLGMLVGCVTAFVGNRIIKKPRRRPVGGAGG